MLRNLVIVGAAAIVAAMVPGFLSDNPDLLRSILGQGETEAHTPARLDVAVTRMPAPQAPPEGSSVRLAADGRGHWVAEFRMNGVRVEGLVDTGATLVALNRSTAARLGIRPASSDFVHEVGTANGRTRAAAATIDEIEIGRIRVRDVEAVVIEDAALSVTLVGMSFLSKLSRFQADGKSLLLER